MDVKLIGIRVSESEAKLLKRLERTDFSKFRELVMFLMSRGGVVKI